MWKSRSSEPDIALFWAAEIPRDPALAARIYPHTALTHAAIYAPLLAAVGVGIATAALSVYPTPIRFLIGFLAFEIPFGICGWLVSWAIRRAHVQVFCFGSALDANLVSVALSPDDEGLHVRMAIRGEAEKRTYELQDRSRLGLFVKTLLGAPSVVHHARIIGAHAKVPHLAFGPVVMACKRVGSAESAASSN